MNTWQEILADNSDTTVADALKDLVRPAAQCKAAGLKSLKELSDIVQQSEQTLINWHRNKPVLFRVVILGAVAHKEIL